MRMVELLNEDERHYLVKCLTQESFRTYVTSVVDTLSEAKRTFIETKWMTRTDKDYTTLRAYDKYIDMFTEILVEVRNMVEPK